MQTGTNGVIMPFNSDFSDNSFNWTLWTNNAGVVSGQFGSQFVDASPCVVTMYYIKTS